jgi:ATP-dependent DNA helicase RecQ
MADMTLLDEANRILRDALKNESANLTRLQCDVIQQIVAGKNTIFVDQTGAGKSATYFISTLLLRKNKENGPTIVICPLLALMNDQVSITLK